MPSTLIIKRDTLGTVPDHTQELTRKKKQNEPEDTPTFDAVLEQINAYLEVIEAPGIPEIKQIELGTKYRPLVPHEFQSNSLYAVPSAKLMKRHRAGQKAKREKDKKKKEKENSSRYLVRYIPVILLLVGSS